jgi:hypothetical protein
VFQPVERPFVPTIHPAKPAWLTRRSSPTCASRRNGRVDPGSGWRRSDERWPTSSRAALGGSWRHLAELVEVESGSLDARPCLSEALALCRLHGATLVIAKLDRLSRDAAFLLNLQKAGVRFVAGDMPEANELVVGIMAVVAQAERKLISARTKAALAAAKARGVRLGKPENLSNRETGQARGRTQQRVERRSVPWISRR